MTNVKIMQKNRRHCAFLKNAQVKISVDKVDYTNIFNIYQNGMTYLTSIKKNNFIIYISLLVSKEIKKNNES